MKLACALMLAVVVVVVAARMPRSHDAPPTTFVYHATDSASPHSAVAQEMQPHRDFRGLDESDSSSGSYSDSYDWSYSDSYDWSYSDSYDWSEISDCDWYGCDMNNPEFPWNLTAPYPTVPLTFCDEPFKRFYGVLYAVTDVKQLPTILVPVVTTAATDSGASGGVLSQNISVYLQVGWSATPLQGVSVGGATCPAIASDTPYPWFPFTDFSTDPNGYCGSIGTCTQPLNISATITPSSGIVNAFPTIAVSVSPAFSRDIASLCSSSLLYALVYTDVPVFRGALSAYAALDVLTGTAGSENTSATNALLAADTISQTPRFWNGSRSGGLHLTRAPLSATLRYGVSEQVGATLFTFLPNASLGVANASTLPLTLSNETSLTVDCVVHDANGFTMELIRDYYYDVYTHDCGAVSTNSAISTPADLAAKCLSDTTCVGFTTYIQNTSNTMFEVPYCILRAGNFDYLGSSHPRMVYRRRAKGEQQCKAVTQHSGKLEVWVEQTSLSTGSVDVYVNGFYAVTCGKSTTYPFASGASGSSGRCGDFNLCFSGQTFPNAEVLVLPTTNFGIGSSSSSCTGALHVVVRQTTIDDPQIIDTRPRYSPPDELVDFSSLFQYSRPVELKFNVDTLITIYVRGAMRGVLQLDQTGYACDPATTCVDYAVEAYMDTPDGWWTDSMYCGGNVSFNGFPGLSNQCNTKYFCGSIMEEWYTSSGLEGWYWISPWITDIFAKGGAQCRYFSGTASVSSKDYYGYDSDLSGPLGFVLPAAETVFNAVIVAPWGFYSEDVNSTYLINVSSSAQITILENLYAGPNYDSVFFVNWKYVERTQLQSYTMEACIFDWVSADTATCTMLVPSGANYITLMVQQSTFDPSRIQNVVTATFNALLPGATRPTPAFTVQCGGSLGFMGTPGIPRSCNTYLNCTDRFLYRTDDLRTSAPITSVTISVPRTISAGQPCMASGLVFAQFQDNPKQPAATCEYLCAFNRECISFDNVCDGRPDCIDGADEMQCTGFRVAEKGMMFNVTSASNATQATVYYGQTYLGCLRRAAGHASSFFAFSTTTQQCYVYNATLAVQLGLDPLPYLVNRSGVTLYMSDSATYSICTSANRCSGNGVVQVTTAGDVQKCTCFCNVGYQGDRCNSVVAITGFSGIIVGFPRNSTTLVSDLLTDTQSTLVFLGFTNFLCNRAVRLDDGDIGISCDGAIGSTGEQILKSVDAVGIFNTYLRPEDDRAVSIQLASVPSYAFLSSCSAASSGNSSAGTSCPLPQPQRIRNVVTTWSQAGSPSLVVSVTSSGSGSTSSRRSGAGASVTQFSCNAAQTVTVSPGAEDTCATYSCLVPVGGSGVTHIDVGFADAAAATSPSCQPSVSSVSFTTALNAPTVATPPVIVSSPVDYRAFLIGGIALLVAAGIVFLVASGFFWVDRRHILELTHDTVYSDKSALHKMLRVTFIQMGWYQREDVVIRQEKWSVATLVIGANLLISGVFLILFYITANGFESNCSILVEEFLTPLCDASSTSSAPLRSFTVDSTSALDCRQRPLTGISTNQIYAAGYCDEVNGIATAFIKVQESASTCDASSYLSVASGSCSAASSILPASSVGGGNATTYVKITCGLNADVASRFTALTLLSDSATQDDTILTEELTDALTQHWTRPSELVVTANASAGGSGPESTTYYFQREDASATVPLQQTSSLLPTQFESVAPQATDADSLTPARVLVVLPNLTYLGGAVGQTSLLNDTVAVNVSTTLASNVTWLEDTTLGPRDADLALGRIFNNFPSPGLSGAAASVGSSSYFDMAGSDVDLGVQFGETSSPGEGDGVTISMYLRCTRDTAGFAFALTDGYVNFAAKTSPTILKAIQMINQNSDSESWFASAYHLYASLYVDGAAGNLHFVHANPKVKIDGNASTTAALENRFENLVWDVDTLGLGFLFNGLWHHVVIILRAQNGQTKAQLMVDGITSLSANGWNQCMERRPTAIQNASIGSSAPAFSAGQERLYQGGLLTTGHFNGGIGHLRFRPYVVAKFDLWREAPTAVAEYNSVNTNKYTGLGLTMLILGVAFFLYMVIHSGMEIFHDRVTTQMQMLETATDVYESLLQHKHFPHKALQLDLVLTWLGLSEEQFLIFVEELNASVHDPVRELFRVLYMVRTAQRHKTSIQVNVPMPKNSEWKDLVEFDEEERNPKKKWDALRTKFTKGKLDLTKLKASVMAPTSGASGTATGKGLLGALGRLGKPPAAAAAVPAATDDGRETSGASVAKLDTNAVEMIALPAAGGALAADGMEVVDVAASPTAPAEAPQPAPAVAAPAAAAASSDLPPLAQPAGGLLRKESMRHDAARRRSSVNNEKPIKSMGSLISFMMRRNMIKVSTPTKNRNGEGSNSDDEEIVVQKDVNKSAGGGTVDVSKAGAAVSNTGNSGGGGSGEKTTNANNGGGTSMSGQLAVTSMDRSLPPAMKELAAPVLIVVQSIYVWLNSIPFPDVYDTYFRRFFSFISIDWAIALPDVPTIVTPLLQFFAGMVVFAFIVYHAKMDEYRFAWHLARYVLKRDQVLRKERAAALAASASVREDKRSPMLTVRRTGSKPDLLHLEHIEEIAKDFAYPFGNYTSTDYEYRVHVLPVKECQKLDRFVGLAKVEEREDDDDEGTQGHKQRQPVSHHRASLIDVETLTIVDDKQRSYLVAKPPGSFSSALNAADMRLYLDVQPLPSGADATAPQQLLPAAASTSTTNAAAAVRPLPSADASVPPPAEPHGRTNSIEVVSLEDKSTPVTSPVVALATTSASASSGDSDETKVGMTNAAAAAELGGRGAVDRAPVVVAFEETKEPKDALGKDGPEGIDVVGCECREHVGRALTAQRQSSVWPYIFPPSCCVVANGRRCGCSVGTVFSCGQRTVNEDGSITVCDYAVCERHIRLSTSQLIRSMVLDIPRTVETQGVSWLIATILLLVANAVYTPFMQTAMQILACTPVFQCEFQHCWGSSIDQKFALAVYLCLVIVLFLGVGLPLLQTMQLRRSREMMRTAFFSDEYNGAFESDEDDEEEEGETVSQRSAGGGGELGTPGKGTPAVDAYRRTAWSDAQQQAKAEKRRKRLKMAEWLRFVGSDPTVMGTLYKSLEFEWLYMSPIILAWKVVLIVPAVFLPQDTFEQRLGISVVQLAFAVFMFGTMPFVSPIVDAMYRLGCVHQLLFLGIDSLSVVERYYGRKDYSVTLTIVTLTYLILALVLMVWTNVVPVVRQVLNTRATTKVLLKLGYQYSLTTTMYLTPNEDRVQRTERAVVQDYFGL